MPTPNSPPDHASTMSQLDLLLSRTIQPSFLKNLLPTPKPASPSAASTKPSSFSAFRAPTSQPPPPPILAAIEAEFAAHTARDGAGVGFAGKARDGASAGLSKEDRELKARLMRGRSGGEKRKAAVAESSSDEEEGRSGVGRRKRGKVVAVQEEESAAVARGEDLKVVMVVGEGEEGAVVEKGVEAEGRSTYTAASRNEGRVVVDGVRIQGEISPKASKKKNKKRKKKHKNGVSG